MPVRRLILVLKSCISFKVFKVRDFVHILPRISWVAREAIRVVIVDNSSLCRVLVVQYYFDGEKFIPRISNPVHHYVFLSSLVLCNRLFKAKILLNP